jgi:hypothetical protein
LPLFTLRTGDAVIVTVIAVVGRAKRATAFGTVVVGKDFDEFLKHFEVSFFVIDD